VDDGREEPGVAVAEVPVEGSSSDLGRYARMGVRYLVVAKRHITDDDTAYFRRRYGRAFGRLTVVAGGHGATRVGAVTTDLAGGLGLALPGAARIRRHRVAKALLDAALLLPALVVGVPLIVLAAVAVVLTSPGRPFYAQEREGLNGRTIRVWKLRTMHRDAEALLDRYLEEQPARRIEWERHFKLDRDPRILPVVGHVLRMTSLDELPQLFNVLRGDMSFVGPRPFPRYHLEAFSSEFRALRSSVRPGITGLWQVSARSDGDLRVQEELDSLYLMHWSIWMDLYVVARTPLAVLSGRGAR
jgi:lipopolysaccharide/colanic/teichoic acid biosynthesis glycosyltransferase